MSEPARRGVLEVLAANAVEVMLDGREDQLQVARRWGVGALEGEDQAVIEEVILGNKLCCKMRLSRSNPVRCASPKRLGGFQ